MTLRKQRTRTEWRKKIFANRIVDWGERRGIWRLVGLKKDIVILGHNSSINKLELFSDKYFNIIYQSVLVSVLAAVDKLLHEAVSQNFSHLLRKGLLDDYFSKSTFSLADAYNIAIASRERSGKGGKIKRRPSYKFKEKLFDHLYERSFLATRKLEELCIDLNRKDIFSKYAKKKGGTRGAKYYKKEWTTVYKLRNDIVHECSIIRKQKAKRVDKRSISSKKLLEHIVFIKEFGKFLADELQTN